MRCGSFGQRAVPARQFAGFLQRQLWRKQAPSCRPDELGKVFRIGEQLAAKRQKGNLRRGDHQEEREEHDVHEEDNHEGEKGAVISQVGLSFGNHPQREAEVKRPGRAEQQKQPLKRREQEESPGRGGDIEEQTRAGVDQDDDDAVERIKVRRERNPEVVRVGDDVAAATVPAFKLQDAPVAKPNPDGMRQFVAIDIDAERARFPIKPHAADEPKRPKSRAQGKEPKLRGAPEFLLHRGAMKGGEEGLREQPDDREKQHAGDKLDEARRDHPRLRSRGCGGKCEPPASLLVACFHPRGGNRFGWSAAAHAGAPL